MSIPSNPMASGQSPTITSSTPSQSKVSDAPPGRLYAPPLGARIEVLWRIESGAEGQPDEIIERWWGAVVQDCTKETAKAMLTSAQNSVGNKLLDMYNEERVHVLLYDAYGEFEEDTASVVFLPNKRIVDMARVDEEQGGVLDWRIEGEGNKEPMEMKLTDLANEADLMATEAGLSENAAMEALRSYPASVQIEAASRYRLFADGVKQMLGELLRGKGEDYVITESDMKVIFQRMQEKSDSEKLQQAGM